MGSHLERKLRFKVESAIHFLCFIYIFSFIFSVKLSHSLGGVALTHLVIVVPVVVVLLKRGFRMPSNVNQVFLLGFIILVLYSMVQINVSLMRQHDYDYVLAGNAVLSLMYFISFLSFFSLLDRKGIDAMVYLIKLMFAAITLNAIFVLVKAFDVAVISEVFDLFSYSKKQNKYNSGDSAFMRYSGLSHSGFSPLSILFSYSALFSYIIMSNLRSSVLKASVFHVLVLVCVLVTVAAILFVARSGVLSFIMFLLIILLFEYRAFFSRIGYLPVLLLVALFFIDQSELIDRGQLGFALGFLSGGDSQGIHEQGVFSLVLDEYNRLPEISGISILFGSGDLGAMTQGSNWVSDPGYVKLIHGIGIPFSFMYFPLYLIQFSFNLVRRVRWLGVLVLSNLVCVLFFNIKDLYFLASFQFKLLCMLVVFLSYNSYSLRNKRLGYSYE